jgi:hypothetical protein
MMLFRRSSKSEVSKLVAKVALVFASQQCKMLPAHEVTGSRTTLNTQGATRIFNLEEIKLTVLLMSGTTSKHTTIGISIASSISSGGLIHLVFLVQRGDDIDLATLTAKNAAPASEK